MYQLILVPERPVGNPNQSSTMGDIKDKEEKAKAPGHGPVRHSLGTSEGFHVPLRCEVCQGEIPSDPSPSFSWIFQGSGVYFSATDSHNRDDTQSVACLIVGLLRNSTSRRAAVGEEPAEQHQRPPRSGTNAILEIHGSIIPWGRMGSSSVRKERH